MNIRRPGFTACVWRQVRKELDEERLGREDATAAVVKLRSVIESVASDLQDAQEAADRCATRPRDCFESISLNASV